MDYFLVDRCRRTGRACDDVTIQDDYWTRAPDGMTHASVYTITRNERKRQRKNECGINRLKPDEESRGVQKEANVSFEVCFNITTELSRMERTLAKVSGHDGVTVAGGPLPRD